MSAASQDNMQGLNQDATRAPARPAKRLIFTMLKALGALLMLLSILTVLFGSWAISHSSELILLCMFVWIGGFALFITARVKE